MKFPWRTFLGEFLFWLHLPVVLIWVGMFLLPLSWWESKIIFHFWFVMIVFASQIIWGIAILPIRRKFGTGVCPLTTLTQKVRGFSVTDPRNYNHTFIVEFCERFHVQLRPGVLNVLLIATLLAVSIQFAGTRYLG